MEQSAVPVCLVEWVVDVCTKPFDVGLQFPFGMCVYEVEDEGQVAGGG